MGLGQVKSEGTALPGGAGETDFTAKQPRDFAADRQP